MPEKKKKGNPELATASFQGADKMKPIKSEKKKDTKKIIGG